MREDLEMLAFDKSVEIDGLKIMLDFWRDKEAVEEAHKIDVKAFLRRIKKGLLKNMTKEEYRMGMIKMLELDLLKCELELKNINLKITTILN